MSKYFLLIFILAGFISCKSKVNFAEKARLSENVLQNIPREMLTTPFSSLIDRQLAEMRVYMDSSAYIQKALPLKKQLDPVLLRKQADSLFVHRVDGDSLRRLILKGGLFSDSLNPAKYNPGDRRLLAMAMDMEHDSLLRRCAREWKAYFKDLEPSFKKGHRRLFSEMVRLHQAWNPRNRNLNEADIAFVVSAESARFLRNMQNGYIVKLMAMQKDRGVLGKTCPLLRQKGFLYYSRVYLAAYNDIVTARLNGAGRAL